MSTTNGFIKLAGDAGDHAASASVVGSNLELVGSGGTTFTFNSTTNATIDIPLSSLATIKGIQITMQGGNDTLSFDATGLATDSGDVLVNLGDGTNSLTFQHATLTGRMIVNGGNGADAIHLSNDILGALSISTGDGNDTVDLSTISIQGVDAFADFDGDGEWELGDWGDWRQGASIFWEHVRHSLDGSLKIQTGGGNDTVNLNSVTGPTESDSGDPWDLFDGLWSLGKQWQISLGSGTDTVNFNSIHAAKSLTVMGGFGNDTVNVNNSTMDARTNFALGLGNDQISVNQTTFAESARLSTGWGDGQSISVDDSTFQSSASFSIPGKNAQLNLEHGGTAGPGTKFEGPVVVSLPGPSAIANFSGPTPNNTLTFDEFVGVFGGIPAATVNIATANTTIDNNKLFLFSANRNNV